MALIQIRDVPEDAYEVLRRRAHRAGQSIQAYLLAQIAELSRRPTPAEVIAELEEELAGRPALVVDTEALLDDIGSGRPA